MLEEILGFKLPIDATTVVGGGFWSIALYLGLSSIADWIAQQIQRWFNFAERSLYISLEEYERTKIARENQNAFYASLFSIIPFFLVGIFLDIGIEISLGRSWAVSFGILACVTCGIYELGRRTGEY